MEKKENKFLPLIAGAAIQLCIGIIYIWSIFQPAVMEYYSWSSADASLTFNIMLATFVLGIVTGGRISDKKGPRPVVFLGGILFCAGIFLSSLVPQSMPQLIWLFYGGLAASAWALPTPPPSPARRSGSWTKKASPPASSCARSALLRWCSPPLQTRF